MRSLIAPLGVSLAACGGHPHPPPFDAHGLAAALDTGLADMATASRRLAASCTELVPELDRLLARLRPTIDQVERAKQDPEHARRLTAELRTYDRAATGRSDAIANALAACYLDHRELQAEIKRIVDSMPTL